MRGKQQEGAEKKSQQRFHPLRLASCGEQVGELTAGGFLMTLSSIFLVRYNWFSFQHSIFFPLTALCTIRSFMFLWCVCIYCLCLLILRSVSTVTMHMCPIWILSALCTYILTIYIYIYIYKSICLIGKYDEYDWLYRCFKSLILLKEIMQNVSNFC